MTVKVDTRGRSCPEPVLLTKQAVEGERDEKIEILTDSQVAKDNILRYIKSKGLSADVEEEEQHTRITVEKPE